MSRRIILFAMLVCVLLILAGCTGADDKTTDTATENVPGNIGEDITDNIQTENPPSEEIPPVADAESEAENGTETEENSADGDAEDHVPTEEETEQDNIPETDEENETEAEEDGEEPVEENTELYVLMYHNIAIGDGDYDAWTLTAERMREDLQWLRDNGYEFVLPRDLAAGKSLPPKAVMLTFDDGYLSNYLYLFPLLYEFDAKAAISLITEHTETGHENHLSWQMCRVMHKSGLVEFGSHTYALHDGEEADGIVRLSGESREEYEQRVFSDIDKSVGLIETKLETEVTFFTYPHGLKEKWAEEFIREKFDVTLITKYGKTDIKKGLYDIKRYNISMTDKPSKFLPQNENVN